MGDSLARRGGRCVTMPRGRRTAGLDGDGMRKREHEAEWSAWARVRLAALATAGERGAVAPPPEAPDAAASGLPAEAARAVLLVETLERSPTLRAELARQTGARCPTVAALAALLGE